MLAAIDASSRRPAHSVIVCVRVCVSDSLQSEILLAWKEFAVWTLLRKEAHSEYVCVCARLCACQESSFVCVREM